MAWRVAAGTLRGARDENQDAYAVVADGIGVFDGVAGAPNGRAAAQAAAAGFPKAVTQADPLATLDRVVRPTGGATTAVVARLGASVRLWSVGDSCAFIVDGSAEPVTPLDRADRILTQCLGRPFRGHAASIRVAPGQRLLLCTDGVSDVVCAETLVDCIVDDLEASVERILTAVEAAGAPDNATAVLAAPTLDAAKP